MQLVASVCVWVCLSEFVIQIFFLSEEAKIYLPAKNLLEQIAPYYCY